MIKNTERLQLILEDLIENNRNWGGRGKENLELIGELIEEIEYNSRYKSNEWRNIGDHLREIYHDDEIVIEHIY